MNKIVFTLGAITVLAGVCACALVIDPDKLVEGNASPEDASTDASTADSTTAPDGGGPDAVADGPTFIEVPECVPEPPEGTTGPYAVTFTTLPTKAVCPAGYLATPFASARGDLVAEGIACGSTAGCSCSANGTPACNYRLHYFNDGLCAASQGSDALSSACLDIDSFDYLKVVTAIDGVGCTSVGAETAAPTAKPTPSYREEWVVCSPDPNVKLAQCKAGQVGLPPAKDAGACVIMTGDGSCPAPYAEDIGLSKSGTFADERACVCSCGVAASSCNAGSATLFSEGTCTGGTSRTFPIDTCAARNGDDGMTVVAPTPGTATCTAKVTPAGTYNPVNDLHLCCLP